MENKKEFEGSVEDISPMNLINPRNVNSFQDFFIILGLIFNDIKDLIFFYELIKDEYRKPGESEISGHSGEYGGLTSHVDRLIISTVSEFFIFIDKNQKIFDDVKYKLLIKNAKDLSYKKEWNELISFNNSGILSKIARVRSNLTFHYDHTMKELRTGFVNSFFKKEKDSPKHARAYYSLGNELKNTRIYFSDAAAESYINSLIDPSDRKEIITAVNRMHMTIQWLLRIYIQDVKSKLQK